jgi:hypothetical protein
VIHSRKSGIEELCGDAGRKIDWSESQHDDARDNEGGRIGVDGDNILVRPKTLDMWRKYLW